MRKCLVEQDGNDWQGDFGGGRPADLYWTFERSEEGADRALDVPARAGSDLIQPFGWVSATQEPSGGGISSEKIANTQGDPKLDESPVFHDTEDFPVEGVVIEDAEGLPIQVLEAKGGQRLRVRDRHDRNAPIKERRWMLDVFPVGHKAKAEEDALYFSLIENERI